MPPALVSPQTQASLLALTSVGVMVRINQQQAWRGVGITSRWRHTPVGVGGGGCLCARVSMCVHQHVCALYCMCEHAQQHNVNTADRPHTAVMCRGAACTCEKAELCMHTHSTIAASSASTPSPVFADTCNTSVTLMSNASAICAATPAGSAAGRSTCRVCCMRCKHACHSNTLNSLHHFIRNKILERSCTIIEQNT